MGQHEAPVLDVTTGTSSLAIGFFTLKLWHFVLFVGPFAQKGLSQVWKPFCFAAEEITTRWAFEGCKGLL